MKRILQAILAAIPEFMFLPVIIVWQAWEEWNKARK